MTGGTGMKKNIGIDIGGTKVLMGVVDEQGTVHAEKKIAMEPAKPPKEMIGEIARALKKMLEDAGIRLGEIGFIGAGVPGTTNTKTGIVEYCPNISWVDVPAGEYFRQALGREVLLSQDSWLAALGESLFGAGKNYDSIACITLGTGIGCGLIYDRKIFGGGLGTAGELGHTVFVPGGRDCPCGRQGCLERYSSGTGILLEAKERYPDAFSGVKRTEDVFELAYGGNEPAKEVIADCVDKLAFGIAALVNLVAPQAVVISGGLCVHEELVVAPLEREVYRQGYVAWTRKKQFRILPAELGSRAPIDRKSVV